MRQMFCQSYNYIKIYIIIYFDLNSNNEMKHMNIDAGYWGNPSKTHREPGKEYASYNC